jgi:hypothetical protein
MMMSRASFLILVGAPALLWGCASGVSGGGSSEPDTLGPSDGTAEIGLEARTSCSAGCDDKLDCTDDSCVGGYCVSTPRSGTCVIGGACHKTGDTAPSTSCSRCLPSVSTRSWSDDSTACPDDGLSCTTATCSSGSCATKVASGYCLIGKSCIAKDTANPSNPCAVCAPSSSTTSYTSRADGTACTADAYSCTTDTCKSSACTHSVASGYCLISSACYTQGQSNPGNSCQQCASASSTSWTAKASGTACSGGKCVNASCCTGCISGTSCLAGTSSSACGSQGSTCATCGSTQSCQSGTCATSALQLSLGAFDSNYTSTSGTRGYYFTAPIAFTIVGLRVPTDVGTDVQNIQVVRFTGGPPPVYPTTTSAFVSLSYLQGVAGSAFISVNIPVQAGQIIGVLGARGTTTMNNSYAATTSYTTSFNGQPATLQRLLVQSNLYQQASTDLATETSGSYSRVEMQYQP